MRCVLCFLSLLITSSLLAADDTPPTITIPRIDHVPVLDDFAGMEPGPKVAGRMVRASGFIQREPYDGKAATFDTHVYLAYDDKNLYAVFLAFDPEPDKIRARMSPREQVFQDDNLNIQIDPVNDKRRGFTFACTPLGIQWDGLYTEGKDFDQSYDALWYSDGRITDRGYMVRMAIPFSGLRSGDADEQVWRVIFNRTIPRLNEESFWPRYTINIQGRLNQAAEMHGIRGIAPGRNMRLNPYVFARNYRALDPEQAAFISDDFDPEVGLDGKVVIRDAFVLDVTANPDFSQVESDEPQVTVNQRFEVNFPERRPFFLENADFFKTPSNLVFTRRIVEPSAGVRFTGKKNGWSVGALLIDDEAPGRRLPEDDAHYGDAAAIGILRLNKDVWHQSTLGLLHTQRRFADTTNRVTGVDGRLRLNDQWVSDFQVAHAETERDGVTREGNSYNVSVNRGGRHLEMHNHLLRTDPGFATHLGFLNGDQRPDSKNLHHQTTYVFRPEKGSLVSWEPYAHVGRVIDTDNESLDTNFRTGVQLEWHNNMHLAFEYGTNRQRLTSRDFHQTADDITLTDRYSRLAWSGEWTSLLQFGAEATVGESVNFEPAAGQLPALADLVELEGDVTVRPIAPLQIDATYIYVSLDDPVAGGNIFADTIARLRANWQFTRGWSLRFINQWEDTRADPEKTSLTRRRNWNTDLLVRYVVNPWTALYVGFNDNRANLRLVDGEHGTEVVRTDGRLYDNGRQYFLKFSYLFQF